MNEIAVHWPTCAGGGQGRPITGFEIARNMPPAYRRVNCHNRRGLRCAGGEAQLTRRAWDAYPPDRVFACGRRSCAAFAKRYRSLDCAASRMASLEGATDRLEQAVSRLETWARHRREAGGIDDSRVAEALSEVRADYQALQETIQTVRARLDAAIERLQSILER